MPSVHMQLWRIYTFHDCTRLASDGNGGVEAGCDADLL